jgi:hypothetical protein
MQILKTLPCYYFHCKCITQIADYQTQNVKVDLQINLEDRSKSGGQNGLI